MKHYEIHFLNKKNNKNRFYEFRRVDVDGLVELADGLVELAYVKRSLLLATVCLKNYSISTNPVV